MSANMVLLLIELIDLATVAVTRGPALMAAFRDHRDRVRAMVAEGREPTDDEVTALRDEIAALRRRLHAD